MGKVAAHLCKTVAIILKCDANLYRQIVQLACQICLFDFMNQPVITVRAIIVQNARPMYMAL